MYESLRAGSQDGWRDDKKSQELEARQRWVIWRKFMTRSIRDMMVYQKPAR
jgi:hypothetical protein